MCTYVYIYICVYIVIVVQIVVNIVVKIVVQIVINHLNVARKLPPKPKAATMGGGLPPPTPRDFRGAAPLELPAREGLLHRKKLFSDLPDGRVDDGRVCQELI